MGRRGPQPKPQQLKELEGNPGKRALNEDAPKARGRAEAPEYLTEYAREVWEDVTWSMPPDLYAKCDSFLLAAFCEAVALHREAVETLKTEGKVSTGQNGAPYQNPWVSIQNKQAQLIVTLGGRLGLDLISRENLKLPQKEKPQSKFAGLVGIPGGRKE